MSKVYAWGWSYMTDTQDWGITASSCDQDGRSFVKLPCRTLLNIEMLHIKLLMPAAGPLGGTQCLSLIGGATDRGAL